jgi:ABC-type sugar transport system substrate-binding protein
MTRGLVALASVLVVALTACGGSSKTTQASSGKACPKTYTIGFSHSFSDAPVIQVARHFTEVRAKQLGCIKMLQDNTTGGNVQAQVTAINAWITQKVDAIIAVPTDPGAIGAVAKRAQAAGIKWISYNTPLPGADGRVGADPNGTASGTLAAQTAIAWAKKTYPQGGVKALVMTLNALTFLKPRWETEIRLLKAAGIDVVAEQDAADPTTGLKVTTAILHKYPDLSMVIGVNDDGALGAYRAFKNAKKDPKKSFIIGQDGNLDGLQAIKEGLEYQASVAVPIDKFSAALVDAAMASLTGKGKTEFDISPVVVTAGTPELLDHLIANYHSGAN